jgi:hypothetical protein
VARVDREADRVIVRFDRVAPHAAVVPDQVRLDLGETPPGRYTLTVEVTDSVTGRKDSRTVPLLIRE